MDWIKVAAIVVANAILALWLIRWSGKEGKAFRKKLKESK